MTSSPTVSPSGLSGSTAPQLAKACPSPDTVVLWSCPGSHALTFECTAHRDNLVIGGWTVIIAVDKEKRLESPAFDGCLSARILLGLRASWLVC